MLLEISTTHSPPSDLGYLLHKHPGRVQTFKLAFGNAHVFYPEASAERCVAALLIDVDPVALVRGKGRERTLDQYVNDRPYVASSMLAVAIAQVFGTALSGSCKDRPELANTPIALSATLASMPCHGGEQLLRRLFEPLGYGLTATSHALDAQVPDWGAAVFCAQVSGLDEFMSAKSMWLAAGTVFCTTVAVYLLDRVKLHDSWIDPADAQSHPRRHAFVLGHTRMLRIACSLLLIAAGWLGSQLMPFGWALPLIAAAGVLVYAGQPRAARPRPKDILLVKNAYVASGIAGFAALVTIAAATPSAAGAAMQDTVSAHAITLLLASTHLTLRVLADAVLCDLDDEQTDRRFNTRTLPVHVGRMRAWNAALAIRLGSATALAAIPLLPLRPRLGWAFVTVVSSILLRVTAPSRLRDWVDGRLAIEGIVVGGILLWLRGW